MDKKKRPHLSLVLQIVILVLVALSGILTLSSPKRITTLGYVCMWFITMVQTLGLIADCYQRIDKGEEKSEDDSEEE